MATAISFRDDVSSNGSQRLTRMIAYLSERENGVEQVNEICMRLFDTWCARRSVTSLAYLMHCWPMIDSTPGALRRLGETMRDLRRYHANQLDADDFSSLCEIADLIEDLIGTPRANGATVGRGEAEEQV